MKAVVDFIGRLGKVLDAAGLAAEGHTDLVIAIEDAAFKALHHLLDQESKPVFNFVDGDVIFANQRVRRLSAWKWTTHLTRAGVERIEISQGVARKEFGDFLTVLLARLYPATGGATDESVPTPCAAFSHAPFGPLDPGGPGGDHDTGPDTDVMSTQQVEKLGGGLNPSQLTVQSEWPDGSNSSGSHVTVTSEYEFQPIFDFLGLASFTMTSSSTMRITN